MLRRTLERSKRVREIGRILIKYGFEEFVYDVGLGGGFRTIKRLVRRRERTPIVETTRWERLRLAFEELGPTFIKFGQILSNRSDIFPKEVVDELAKLQDSVAPFPAVEARKAVEFCLGKTINEVMSSFDDEPVASASIAQVHRGTLQNGREIAIKVKRPDIDSKVGSDVAILTTLANLAERHLPQLRIFGPKELVSGFRRQIEKELDFTRELLTIKRMKIEAKQVEGVRIPEVYAELSDRSVLIMEFIPGEKISTITGGDGAGYNKKLIARRLTELLFTQIFRYGFFHADPHPGNILVLPDSTVCILDFGMVDSVTPKQRFLLSMMMYGIAKQDITTVIDALLDLTAKTEEVDREKLELRGHQLLEDYSALPLRYVNMRSALHELLNLVVDFQLQLPVNLLYLLKSIGTAEGISRELDPAYNIREAIQPYAERAFREELSLPRLGSDLLISTVQYRRMLRTLPTDLKEIIGIVKEGRINVDVTPRASEVLRSIVEGASNKFVFSLILAALLISSSLIVLSGVSPKWLGIPVIGLAGYLISGVIGFGLVLGVVTRFLRRR